MSVYKVPQDIEAEDKLVGPFTLKQFIFLIVAAISAYLTFVLGTINILLIFLTLPFVVVFGILGIYRRQDQPVELYLASLIRFYLKPRRRLWDQDGMTETVVINAPPKVEHIFTDGRNQGQVIGQLHELAGIMDTRGWSSKNSSLQVPHQRIGGDRLITVNELPNNRQPSEIHASDDILDHRNNNTAQAMNNLAQTYTQNTRQSAIQQMQDTQERVTSQPYPSRMKQRVIEPSKPDVSPNTSTMTEEPTPDIIRLSQNSDLNVSAIANQVAQSTNDFENDEEISLR